MWLRNCYTWHVKVIYNHRYVGRKYEPVVKVDDVIIWCNCSHVITVCALNRHSRQNSAGRWSCYKCVNVGKWAFFFSPFHSYLYYYFVKIKICDWSWECSNEKTKQSINQVRLICIFARIKWTNMSDNIGALDMLFQPIKHSFFYSTFSVPCSKAYT